MKLKNIIPISLIVIFVTSIAVGPALGSNEYRPVIQGQARGERVYNQDTESERYAVTEEEKTGLIAGVFSTANRLVRGTLDMAGAVYDGTEKMAKDILTSSGNTVDSTMETSEAVIDGSLKKSGEIIDGTMQFTDDTVKGTTGAVMGSEK